MAAFLYSIQIHLILANTGSNTVRDIKHLLKSDCVKNEQVHVAYFLNFRCRDEAENLRPYIQANLTHVPNIWLDDRST